jgi:hypothetical protein
MPSGTWHACLRDLDVRVGCRICVFYAICSSTSQGDGRLGFDAITEVAQDELPVKSTCL